MKLGRNLRFQIHVNYFLFWQYIIFLKILLPQHCTCYILLDFDLHYAKLPSYKRVRWGRLAGPSHNYLPTLLCISDDLAPRLIQSIRCNVRNRKKSLKQLCHGWLGMNQSRIFDTFCVSSRFDKCSLVMETSIRLNSNIHTNYWIIIPPVSVYESWGLARYLSYRLGNQVVFKCI